MPAFLHCCPRRNKPDIKYENKPRINAPPSRYEIEKHQNNDDFAYRTESFTKNNDFISNDGGERTAFVPAISVADAFLFVGNVVACIVCARYFRSRLSSANGDINSVCRHAREQA